MVEIRYGEHYEMADLAGKSVAQAREQYKQEFGIPDKAQANLNSKGIRQKHEPMTALGDNDSLTFAQKSRKGLFFIGAVLLTMAITGGIFAYGATTTTVSLTLTGTSDYAAVVAAGSPPTWTVWGKFKGAVTAGDLFTITPETNYTGDMVALVTLANAYDLVEAYRILVLEIEIWDNDAVTPVQMGTTEYLTMDKGVIEIELDQSGFTSPYDVRLVNGFYISHRGVWDAGKEDPTILCDVIQKGT